MTTTTSDAVTAHAGSGRADRHSPRTRRARLAATLLLGAGACSHGTEGPTGPLSLNHAPSPSVTSSTTHGGSVNYLDGQIATNDLIAGLDAEQLPGDLGWVSSIESDTLRVPTDGLGSQSSRYGLLKDLPGSGNPTKRLRYALAAPSDIQEIRVLTGHPFQGSGDARVFSTVVIRYSTDGGLSYHLLGYFQSDPSGTTNAGLWHATLVTVFDNQSPTLVAGATHLELDLFAVGFGTQMRDPYDGVNPYTTTDDGLAAAVSAPYLWEIDVIGEPSSPANQPPTAAAGADQDVASEAAVSLDGSQSSDPDADPMTYTWTQTAGPTVALADADQAVASFTAPVGPASLAFELEVCDPEPLCDTDIVLVSVAAASTDVLDLGAEVTVSGPVKSNGTSKDFVVIVSNAGTVPATIGGQEILGTVSIAGQVVGTVSSADGSKTLAPGRSTRFKMTWNYPAGAFVRGADLVFEACVTAAGDTSPSNDCSTVTVQAR